MIITQLQMDSDTPIYIQIARKFKDDILTGRLNAGEKLPSIRALAKELRISIITTMKAYEELEKEGLVSAVQGKGFFVNAQNTTLIREQYQRIMEKSLIAALDAAQTGGISISELKTTLDTLIKLKEDFS